MDWLSIDTKKRDGGIRSAGLMSANIFGQTFNFGQTFGHFLILFIILEMLSLVQETLIIRDRYVPAKRCAY